MPISSCRDPASGDAAPQLSPERPPDANETTDTFRAALNSVGPRRSKKLHKPAQPLETSFLAAGGGVRHCPRPRREVLGALQRPARLALTVLWTWPIVNTFVGIKGVRRTRELLRASRDHWDGEGPVICEDFLFVTVPTIGRHDTYPALERSVLSFIRYLPRCSPSMRVDILIEEGCEAEARSGALGARSPLIRVIAIPRRYRTPNGTRFKARANHFSHELRIYEREDRDDIWVLHMDDDTGVGPDTAAAMACFIEEQYQAGPGAMHLAQGILTYPRELAVNRLTWLADSIRPADDIGRFSACTGSGVPRAGLHGELLLVRASVEATIGWDFGPRSLVEDAHFALVFGNLHPGRSAWFAGRCYGAS